MQLPKGGDSLANYREHLATFDFTLSALDAHRNDDKIYSIAYYKV